MITYKQRCEGCLCIYNRTYKMKSASAKAKVIPKNL